MKSNRGTMRGVVAVLASLPLACSAPNGGVEQGLSGNQAINLFVNGASAHATLGGACPAQAPCLRITDALAEVRRQRAAGSTSAIHVHVAAGTYAGTYHRDASTPATMEDLPILVNVSNVTIEGDTLLGPADAMGIPTCPAAGCYGSNITTSDFAAPGETLVLVAPTIGGGDVSDVVLRGLSIYYPTHSAGIPLYFDRVSNLRVEENFFLNGTTGPFGRMSTITLVGNVSDGGGGYSAPDFCTTAGNAVHPAQALVYGNRLSRGFVGGFAVGTTDLRTLLLSPTLAQTFTVQPVGPADEGNVIRGAFVNNAMDDNAWAGMRLIQMFNQMPGRPVPPDGDMDVVVVGNTFFRNVRTGLSFDSGFSQRARTEPLTGHFRAVVSGNQFADNGSWPVSISFTRLDPATAPNNLTTWKFLSDSTYELWDVDGELADAHVVDPDCDPFLASCSNPTPPASPGPALDNTLIIHADGSPIPADLAQLIQLGSLGAD
jgi:hypothetical protein